jgi:hypothetical protein
LLEDGFSGFAPGVTKWPAKETSMAAINGAHLIVYSTNVDSDREFFRDVLDLPSVDVGGGWLIFGMPPAEVAVHPAENNDTHELYLMCDDIEVFMSEMGQRNIACSPVQDQGWGLLSHVILPGGGKLGVYQPRHARPEPLGDGAPPARARSARRPAKKKARPAARKALRSASASAKAGKTAGKKTAGRKPASKPATKKRKR